MTAVIPLGNFTPVAVRDAWPTEDDNFTPWLAQPEIIKILSEALGVELEVEGVEHWVGPFRADILARASDEPEHRIIIENQFGRTNHVHLGQILTYLAGVEGAKTVVWLAENIQADHRAAIDWLNTNTTDDFSFFAIEIELWRIGDSHPAPRFNVIASPNDWTKTVRVAARTINDDRDSHRIRRAYWASFAEYLSSRSSRFKIRRQNTDHWFSFGIGRAGFHLNAKVGSEKQWVAVELTMADDPDKSAFNSLIAQRSEIESEIGERLEWLELPGKKASRVVLHRHGVDPADPAQYQELHAWMLERLQRFRDVFGPRVKLLEANHDVDSDD